MKMIKLLSVIITIMVVMEANNVNGLTVTWIGEISIINYWNDASNWDAGVVPTSKDDVVVQFPNTKTLSILFIDYQEAYASTLTLSYVHVAVFAPFKVGQVISTGSSLTVHKDGSPSVFGEVTIDTFDVYIGAAANVTTLVAGDLFLFVSSKLTLTGSESTIRSTLFLVNGGIYGENRTTYVDVEEVFVYADNAASLPEPDYYFSKKQLYAIVVDHKQKIQQKQQDNDQIASTFYSLSQNENLEQEATIVVSSTDSSWSVVPGIISHVQIQAIRFVIYNPRDYPTVLLFEHQGSIYTY